MIDIFALQSRVVDLGRLGENQHRRVVFDVSGYIKQYPDATFTVLNQLPGETGSYPVPTVTHDGDNVCWAVTNADLTKTGNGKCELLVMQGEVIAKSVIYLTRVGEALDGAGEVPDEWESWQTVFAGLKDEAVTAAEGAAEYVQTAEVEAQTAVEAAQSAESAAQAVQDMGVTAETMVPGSEATVEKYVDEHGAVTLAFGIPRGDKGETGDTGATPNLTIGTVETLEPSEDATATITGTPENPMLNLGIPRGDPGDPGDLSGKADVIITSASGNPASFSDGANGAKMTSLVVGIEPVQDLHGYDYPWPAGGGKNLIDINAAFLDSRFTIDGSKVSGLPATFNMAVCYIPENLVNKTLTVSARLTCPSTTNRIYIRATVNGANIDSAQVAAGQTADVSTTFTPVSTNDFFKITYSSGNADYVVADKIQLELGSTVTAYAPYSNICPITGWTGVRVYDDPKYGGTIEWNQLVRNGNFESKYDRRAVNVAYSIADGVATITKKAANPAYINSRTVELIYDHIYVCRATLKGANSFVCLMNVVTNGSFISSLNDYTTNDTEYTDCYCIGRATQAAADNGIFAVRNATAGGSDKTFYAKNVCCFDLTAMFGAGNEPETIDEFRSLFPADYYPYNEGEATCVSAVNGDLYNEYAIDWESEAGTVYGGSLDVVSGVLTVDRAMVDLGTLEWSAVSNARFRANVSSVPTLPSNDNYPPAICSMYKGATPNNYINADNVFHFSSSIHAIYIRDTTYNDAATFKAAMSGVQLVYQLATPITYQLEPHEVTTLLGDNNIWADTGDVAATYRADTKRYIDAKIAKAIEEAMQG